MEYKSYSLKRKLDSDEGNQEETYAFKRHNHYNTYIQSNSSSSVSTPTTEDDMEIDSPLFVNPSSTVAFNTNPNQFHHHQTDVLPATMMSSIKNNNPRSTVCVKNIQKEKIIRLVGIGGYML
ncbi:hypothetical protein G9A89_001045 [Geosiphon pyriformis]|nr:hypothetical protein G9A89_001045 [Geosiphon pyriformis]